MNPYLSMRQAVRPAILAYRLQALEHERARQLAAECEELLALTRELLIAAGQAPAPDGSALGAGDAVGGLADAAGGLADAYADAALGWAKVVGSLLALGGTLADRGEWDEARRIAGALAAAGEQDAAGDLLAQVGKQMWGGYLPRLRQIRSRMPEAEIAASLAMLREVLSNVPTEFADRDREVSRLLVPIAAAVRAFMAARGIEPSLDSRVEHIAAGGVAAYPEIVEMSVAELCAEFDGAR
jgi:hypothetical protein